ncbi:MAG TPA: serine/threonine-protein kinase [Candidatus Hydrogenedens sp.]|nr:serine/threonine-protein kinase [Candidatus Hydrogenedens sp.]HOL20374.1 serine/threonine-protein kinase [Candidatus Hydrogenedens sp.]HPP58717.1 serine/threonine-protein kinase [Candidatus Hydrogenedens sp.]
MNMSDADLAEGKTTRIIAGRYEVIKPLGRGGMGKVFLVKDLQSGQKLALKLMRAQYQHNQKAIARFLREVEAVRQLNHPCIVKIFDAQIEGEQMFYTMEYVEGRSVRDWLNKKGPLSFGNTVRILALIADALEHAHQVTIHRDISPDNVMVLRDGSVRLLDFGLAKLSDAQVPLTMVGANLGKAQYSAPEQRVNAAGVDKRADIYPLGVMFFEMLVGRRPQIGDKLSKLMPDLPKECDEFLQKAMAPDPEDRFSSAKEFRDTLLNLYKLWKEKQEKGAQQKQVPKFSPLSLLRKIGELSKQYVGKILCLFKKRPKP